MLTNDNNISSSQCIIVVIMMPIDCNKLFLLSVRQMSCSFRKASEPAFCYKFTFFTFPLSFRCNYSICCNKAYYTIFFLLLLLLLYPLWWTSWQTTTCAARLSSGQFPEEMPSLLSSYASLTSSLQFLDSRTKVTSRNTETLSVTLATSRYELHQEFKRSFHQLGPLPH